MTDVDTLARRSADDLRRAAASFPVPPLQPRRTSTRGQVFAVAAASLLVLAGIAVWRSGDRDVSVTASGRDGSLSIDALPQAMPHGDGDVIASGLVGESRWWLFRGGPSDELCLAKTIPEPNVTPSVCSGAPFGAPSADPHRPIVNGDDRAPALMAGHLPDGSTRLRVELDDGSSIEITEFVRVDGKNYFIVHLGEEKPVDTVALDDEGHQIGRWRDPPPSKREADVVAQGRAFGGEWQLVVYGSDSGLCVDLRFRRAGSGGGSGGCGFGVPEPWIMSAGYGGGRDDQWVYGVARADVAEIRLELGSGRTLRVPTAGGDRGYGVEFFATPIRLDDGPVRAVAVDEEGKPIAQQGFGPESEGPTNLVS